MYRDGLNAPEPVNMNLVINLGGMGDCIAAMPVLRYMQDSYGDSRTFNIWTFDYLKPLFKKALPDIETFGLTQERLYKPWPALTNNHPKPSQLKMHVTDVTSILLLDQLIPEDKKDYIHIEDFSDIKLPSHRFEDFLEEDRKKIIVSTTHTAVNRAFRGEEIDKLSDMILERGWVPVYVGKSQTKAGNGETIIGNKDEFDTSKGINLLDETSLLELLKIISLSDSVVGVDNGILHLAAMTDVHIVGGYTNVDPRHRLPYRHGVKGWNYDTIVPEESLGCRFCQSHWALDINNRFSKCHYVETKQETRVKCVDSMTADKFIEKLDSSRALR